MKYPEAQNTDREKEISFPAADLVNGENYIITAFVLGKEGMPSDPVESDPFTISW